VPLCIRACFRHFCCCGCCNVSQPAVSMTEGIKCRYNVLHTWIWPAATGNVGDRGWQIIAQQPACTFVGFCECRCPTPQLLLLQPLLSLLLMPCYCIGLNVTSRCGVKNSTGVHDDAIWQRLCHGSLAIISIEAHVHLQPRYCLIYNVLVPVIYTRLCVKKFSSSRCRPSPKKSV